MKGCNGYSMGGTSAKIHSEMRKHRKAGGSVESPMKGDDQAEKDLKDKPARRSASGKPMDESEEMHAKRGGKVKKQVGGVVGAKARANGGRIARASGGGCESNPFTSANKGTAAVGRSVEKVTMGRD